MAPRSSFAAILASAAIATVLGHLNPRVRFSNRRLGGPLSASFDEDLGDSREARFAVAHGSLEAEAASLGLHVVRGNLNAFTLEVRGRNGS